MSRIRDEDGAVGTPLARPNALRLAHGRGRYLDDLQLPRLVHVAFVRSPYAHARIISIDCIAARASPGVVRVFTGRDVAALCKPLVAEAANLAAVRPVAQPVLAIDTVKWQGEPVVAIVAESRAIAEDAAERVIVEWEELATIADPLAALDPGSPLVHAEHGTNLAFTANFQSGDATAGFAAAAFTVERHFTFGRHTAVTLEPRGIVADFETATRALTIYQSHQAPHQLQDIYAVQLGIPEHKVRVICPDVGGGFGIKLALYADELAVAAIAVALGRPVKFVADRLEAFVSDAHARDHRAAARLAVGPSGDLAALEVDDIAAMGAYSTYPRLSFGEGTLMLAQCGAPYRLANYRARLRCVYQNKVAIGTYRGVGQPLACAITEQLIDDAAAGRNEDPITFRRRHLLRDDAFPCSAPGGIVLERLSLRACLDRVAILMNYDGLRTEQAMARARGVCRGIGVIAFIEQTGVGAGLYGPSGLRLTAQDGCTVKLEPSGVVRAITSVTDQGQGTWTGIAQIVADALGVRFEDVEIVAHDTAVTPYGGGAWASRGLSIGGEAAHAAARALKTNVLALAARILQADPQALDLRAGEIRDSASGAARMTLAELARIAHFRQDTLPPDAMPELMVTRHYAPKPHPYSVANGAQASYLEIDVETGFIRLLGHWVVEDCGRVVNPLLVDEQIRGGVVQGIGGALFEHCLYDEAAQLRNASLADYLVPMAFEMPDIMVDHVETPQANTALGAKGAGEAGTVGAPAAILCAVNDALRPLGKRVSDLPITPERVLEALGRVTPS